MRRACRKRSLAPRSRFFLKDKPRDAAEHKRNRTENCQNDGEILDAIEAGGVVAANRNGGARKIEIEPVEQVGGMARRSKPRNDVVRIPAGKVDEVDDKAVGIDQYRSFGMDQTDARIREGIQTEATIEIQNR